MGSAPQRKSGRHYRPTALKGAVTLLHHVERGAVCRYATRACGVVTVSKLAVTTPGSDTSDGPAGLAGCSHIAANSSVRQSLVYSDAIALMGDTGYSE